jgi:hypothetical protein
MEGNKDQDNNYTIAIKMAMMHNKQPTTCPMPSRRNAQEVDARQAAVDKSKAQPKTCARSRCNMPDKQLMMSARPSRRHA